MFEVHCAILGCGWAGTLASYFILENFDNVNVVCVEKENISGGLLRSEIVNGFVFDIGGSHIIFSKDQRILQEMLSFLGNNVVKHHRKTYIYLDDMFVLYPFENGIWVFPPERRAEILVSFVEMLIERARDPDWRPRNLREWIYGFFGKKIARMYLEPYNEKIWKRPLEEIDADWIYTPGRLPIPDWRDVIRSGAGVSNRRIQRASEILLPVERRNTGSV